MARLALALRLRLLLILAAPAALVLLWPAGPAHSAFPGANGKIAFARCEDSGCSSFHIWTMDANGGNQVAITNGGGGDDDPAWSPNGQKIAFQHCDSGCGAPGIVVANADGSGQVPLTPAASPDYYDYPTFSPDGSKVAFAHCPTGATSCSIDVIGLDGSNPHQLTTTLGTNERQSEPVYSPDGSKVAFQDCPGGSPCFIAVAPSGGGSLVQLSNPSNTDSSPDWSPDGSKIVFARCCDSNSDRQVFIMGSDGSNPVALTTPPAGARDDEPAFSPDGSQVIFERYHPGGSWDGVINSVPPGGGTVTPISTPAPGNGDFRATWQPTAPIFASGPILSGKAVNGQTLIATAGAAAGGGTPSLAFSRCNSAGDQCSFIVGAFATRRARAAASTLSYKLTTADIGHTLRVHEAQANAVGSAALDSAPTTVVAPNPKKCSNRFAGTTKRDRLVGTTGGDRISGGRGNDRISGLGGADCLSGGAGNDRISGGAGNDTISGGAGKDTISGGGGRNKISAGSGNDTINVVNRKRDIVNCGKGRDRVRADRRDVLRGCERVRRTKR